MTPPLDIRKIERDPSVTEKGVRVEMPLGWHCQLKPRDNPEYRKLMNRLLFKHRAELAGRRDEIPQSILEDVELECIVETCILDWWGLVCDGTPLHFDKDTAYRLFRDPAYTELYDDVRSVLNTPSLFRKGALEADAGNSPGRSAGTSSGAPSSTFSSSGSAAAPAPRHSKPTSKSGPT